MLILRVGLPIIMGQALEERAELTGSPVPKVEFRAFNLRVDIAKGSMEVLPNQEEEEVGISAVAVAGITVAVAVGPGILGP